MENRPFWRLINQQLIMRIYFTLFVVLVFVSITGLNAQESVIPDGLYPVIELAENETKTDAYATLDFNPMFLAEDQKENPPIVMVDTTDYVPLQLAAKPNTIEQPDKRKRLLLELSDTAADQLEDFSARHLMQKATIVVGGKALTVHRFKEKIVGGKLQISRCTDNACEFLYFELKDNY